MRTQAEAVLLSILMLAKLVSNTLGVGGGWGRGNCIGKAEPTEPEP